MNRFLNWLAPIGIFEPYFKNPERARVFFSISTPAVFVLILLGDVITKW